jgi:nicotinamidase-related amidase
MTTLFEGIEHEMEAYALKVAVVVIDEQGDGVPPKLPPNVVLPADNVTPAQQTVLRFAQSKQIPTWFVEFQPNSGVARVPSKPTLKNCYPTAHAIPKNFFSAFDGTTLDSELKEAGIHSIILMGTAANQCVRISAVGGEKSPQQRTVIVDGAIQKHYSVLTCPEVLRGGPAAQWRQTPGVQFYDSLGVPPT